MNLPLSILIVEDELLAARKLTKMIESELEHISIKHCESVEETIKYINKSIKCPDLVFMDIHLGDGLCFEIFDHVEIKSPIIFTTAYDEYALKAFKWNSIHYLLKPISQDLLHEAIGKFTNAQSTVIPFDLKSLANEFLKGKQSRTFLSKNGEKTTLINDIDIQYFYSEDGYTHCRMTNGQRHIIDQTLDEIQDYMDAHQFFRINRSTIVRKSCIKSFETYLNNRLILDVEPKHHSQIIVARERVKEFKVWLV